MKVLVVGGTGFVGTRLVRLLLEHGHAPVCLGLPGQACPPGVRGIECDRNTPAFAQRLEREEVDAVVDLVAYREAETRAIVGLFSGRIARFVQLSTLSVFAAAHAAEVNEENAVRGGPASSYGGSKGRCEMVLEEAHTRARFPYVILRSAPLMGPGDPVSRENYFLKRLRAGRPIFIPGAPGAHLTVLYVGDLARALLAALVSPQAVARDYNLAQSERLTLEEHIAAIARLSGTRPCLRWEEGDEPARAERNPFAFPYAPLDHTAWVDIGRARAELGFEPTPYPAALECTVDWLLRQRVWPAWPGQGSTQGCLAGTHEWLETDAEVWRATGTDARALDKEPAADELLEQLCADPAYACASRARWAERPWDAPAADAPPAVVLPEALVAALKPEVSIEEAPPPGRLLAVFESVAAAPRAYRLFTQAGARRASGYGFANVPLLVRVARFGDVDTAFAVNPGERLLVAAEDPASLRALRAWLQACAAQGHCRVPSPRSLARVYLLGSQRLARAYGGLCLAFDACRLLLRAAVLATDDPFELALSGDGQWLFPSVGRAGPAGSASISAAGLRLLRAGPRYFAWRPTPTAIFELTPALACVLEARLAFGSDEAALAAALPTILGVSVERAAALDRRAIDVLAGAGLDVDVAHKEQAGPR